MTGTPALKKSWTPISEWFSNTQILLNYLWHLVSDFSNSPYSAAFDIYLSLAILRAPEGLDFSGLIAESYISPVPIAVSAPADRSAVPSGSLDVPGVVAATLKPSASTASGWSEKKANSQESLHSQGKYCPI